MLKDNCRRIIHRQHTERRRGFYVDEEAEADPAKLSKTHSAALSKTPRVAPSPLAYSDCACGLTSRERGVQRGGQRGVQRGAQRRVLERGHFHRLHSGPEGDERLAPFVVPPRSDPTPTPGTTRCMCLCRPAASYSGAQDLHAMHTWCLPLPDRLPPLPPHRSVQSVARALPLWSPDWVRASCRERFSRAGP
jgi:hypothetical protein